MRVLALDTTSALGSAALVQDDVVVAQRIGDPSRSQAEQLPGALTMLLEESGLSFSDVDRLAVAVGPGSFTGIRIGVATIQGLAVVVGRPVAPISALDAMAHASSLALAAGDRVGIWIDARRGEVFSALYEVGSGPPYEKSRFVEIESATVSTPQATLDRWSTLGPAPVVFRGSGAVAYQALLPPGIRIEAGEALASTIGRLAVHCEAADLVPPSQIQPLYVRRPDAEKARDALKAIG